MAAIAIPNDHNDEFFHSVIGRFMCRFMNPIPHRVAVQLVVAGGPMSSVTTDNWLRYWSGLPTLAPDGAVHNPTYEMAIRQTPAPRHMAMLLFLLNQPNVRDHMAVPNGGFLTWLLRAMGCPGFSEEDFTVDNAAMHRAFHARFGSWRMPTELRSALDGRVDPNALTPLLRDMFDWLLSYKPEPMLGPVAAEMGWDNTIRAFMTRYGVLPHAVALQFCLTPDEWQNVAAVTEYMNVSESDDHPHRMQSIHHWIRQSAGWHVPAAGMGGAHLLGLHHRKQLLLWDCLPYAVALHICIGDHERAMTGWLARELHAHHPVIMNMVAQKKSNSRKCRQSNNRHIWYWLMRSVGRAGSCTGFPTHQQHRAFQRRFGSWRIPDEVIERLDHRSGAHGLPPVLEAMYHWIVEHNAYIHWDR